MCVYHTRAFKRARVNRENKEKVVTTLENKSITIMSISCVPELSKKVMKSFSVSHSGVFQVLPRTKDMNRCVASDVSTTQHPI